MANSNEVIFNCLSDLEFVEKLIDNKEKEINTLKKNNLYISKLLKKMASAEKPVFLDFHDALELAREYVFSK